MKKINFGLMLFGLTLFIVSCGSSGPTTKDDLKQLKLYDSYAFLPNKDTIMSPDYNNNEIQNIIIQTINANMKEEGYNLEKLQPDVLVHVHTMFDDKAAINADPVYTNYPYYRPGYYVGPYYKDFIYDNYFTIQRINGPRVKQIPYRERSIVIDLIDRRTNEILWRGSTTEAIEVKRLNREIRENIDRIFREFP
ncbi:DUF4136 domain-containing protein [Christiangramia salexigens]|uniref:DUF4136 domain-containing protein n=1 Tax=Christiangramia salexigens TaxID=1913577 RepID=A0A1L3J4F6_9FLAO|nr:DUF4136 domain-containing protein [Christiangramia salexigens]APG60029.1 hypothetical protein LPB144_06180 [Christiangramia salexigens]